MKLKKLLNNIAYLKIIGSKETEIKGISSDSRSVFPGCLFIAKQGLAVDGTNFISAAVSAGAVAVVTDLYDPFLKNTVQIICENVANIEADIAANYYGFSGRDLFAVGITGTNGKTTISYLIKHILDMEGKRCGLLGTIEYITGSNKVFASLTTPGSVSVQKYLKEMKTDGCKSVVMEVTSHGLEQNRVKHVDFDVAVFTNLTQDHLDYHHSMECYSDAKKKLFDSLGSQNAAIVNIDDIWAAKMIETAKAKIVTYGIKNKADFFADNINVSLDGIEFDLYYDGKIEKIKTPLIGRFNVYNILAAIATAIHAGIEMDNIKKYIACYKNVKGRLEKVGDKDYVFVDFAHTPDALENVLLTLGELKKKRIITVFGCGGNRDRDKRPKMGKIASKLSDFCIITSDNPRKEDPMEIIKDIEKGIVKNNYQIEEDRYKAIEKAMDLAEEGDIVLIAGKGHETTQILANKTIMFDDKKAVEQICLNLADRV